MIIVSGHIRVRPDKMDELRPYMRVALEGTRKEPGCLLYAYGEDVLAQKLTHVNRVSREESTGNCGRTRVGPPPHVRIVRADSLTGGNRSRHLKSRGRAAIPPFRSA